MAHFARRVPVRLGLFKRGLDFALRQIPAPVFVVLLPRLRDVNGGGLRVLGNLHCRLLGHDGLGRPHEQKRCEQSE